jgi:N-acylglucosamine-6-phosphate 2-epimerase
MNPIFEKIRKGLIVSCQAEGDSPFNNPADIAKFAICAHMGGAVAIRSEGVEKIRAILEKVPLPVIGLIKSAFEDGFVKITGSEKEFLSLMEAGCHIIAVDGTFRKREGMSGPEFIRYIKNKYKTVLMADIATAEEGLACAESGADCISTTLSGYTPETLKNNAGEPDFKLLNKLTTYFANDLPVIAEGRFNTPRHARLALDAGAWAVVVGTAITRPQTITKWFYDAIKK